MARLTIHLEPDESGKAVLRIDLDSDEDALPQEHEQLHRELVSELLPSLSLILDNQGSIEIERERPAHEPVVG
jgi:hypothetical protein